MKKVICFFRTNFKCYNYARSLPVEVICYSYIIFLESAIGVLRIAWSEATTTHNSNVPFAYYRSSLCFNTVVAVVLWVWVVQLQLRVLWTVKLCNSNMQCSSGSRLGGKGAAAPTPFAYATASVLVIHFCLSSGLMYWNYHCPSPNFSHDSFFHASKITRCNHCIVLNRCRL